MRNENRKKFNKIVIVGLALLMTMFLAACGSEPEETSSQDNQGQAQGDPIKIGGIFSLSGPAAGVGLLNKEGAELAIEEINANGGVDGRPIEIVVIDDEGNPAKANTAATKLIQQENVLAIVGPSITTTSLAASEVANANETVMISPTFTGDVVPGEYVFRIGLSDKHSVKRMVAVAEEYEKVGILVQSGAPGQSVRNTSIEELKAIGKEPVAIETFDMGTPDMTPQLLNLQKAGAEAILTQALPGDTATVVKGINQIGYEVEIIGHLGFADPTFRKVAQESSEGTFVIDVYDPEKPEAKEFKEKYFKKYGEKDLVYWGGAMQGYDAIYVLTEAIKNAGVDKSKIKDSLEQIKDYPVVSGFEGATISYEPGNHNGHGYAGAVGLQVQGDELVRAALMNQ